MAIGHQSFYQSQLTSDISDTDLIIPLDEVPIPSEGFLVIESTVEAKREIIYYTSKDGTSVTVPSGAGNGRGYDGTTAVSHLQGADVIMAPVGVMFEELGDISVNSITINSTASTEGWSPLGATPDTVTANGNRSYSMVFNSNDLTNTISPGMRLKATRTVTAPTQCADLESSSSQYFNKTSPVGMTFTDDFVVSAWIKLESYADMRIASRYNGTSGWTFGLTSSGQVVMVGYNAGAANLSVVTSSQSVPLNKWVHVAAQLDMSTFTATTTTSYTMIDGVNVPASVSRGGTNPTTLVQAGNLEIGGQNGGLLPFDGKIAQVAIYSAKVTQANVLATMAQGLTGSETSLISAYSLSNSLTDLNTGNANNLTAQNSAVATATDTPFAGGSVGTTEYGIVTAATFSTNTTLTVQVPEGYAIPTTGGVSAVSYSISKIPYGFPIQKSKWFVESWNLADVNNGAATANQYYNVASFQLSVPIGSWTLYGSISIQVSSASSNPKQALATIHTSAGNSTDIEARGHTNSNASLETGGSIVITKDVELTTMTTHYVNIGCGTSAATALYLLGSTRSASIIRATPSYL